MKALRNLLLLVTVSLFSLSLAAQSGTTTIILVRHAEKETVVSGDEMMKADPPLSREGKARAMRLIEALKDFKPTGIYATNFKRTMNTVMPLADVNQLAVQSYDPRNQQPFAEKLKAAAGQTIVVAGHSNTIPRLVNLLLGEEKYADLADSVYNKIFIVRITDGSATVEEREY